MKKLLFVICISLLIVMISCTNETTPTAGNSSMEQKNMTADSTIGAAFRSGDPSKIDSVVAADFVDHTEHGDKNRDSLKMFIKMVHDSMPDMKMDLINAAASGDYVYSQMRFTGNSTGFMGMPKGPYDWHVIEVSKYKDGKAVEHWEYTESRDVAKMMKDMMNMTAPGANKMEPKK